MKLKYSMNVTTEKTRFSATYNLQLPEFIIELLEKAYKNNYQTVESYIDSKFEHSDSSLSKLAKASFGIFSEVLTSYDLKEKDKIDFILNHGYIVKNENFNISIKSYSPLLQRVGVIFNGKEFMLNSVDQLEVALSQIVKKQIPNSFNVSCDVEKTNSSTAELVSIQLDLEQNGFSYNGVPVEQSTINFGILQNNNSLTNGITNVIDKLESHYKYLSTEVWNQHLAWTKYEDLSLKVQENSIEVINFGLFKNVPVYWRDSVVASEFNKNHKLYVYLLNAYKIGIIDINKNIFSHFISNEKDIVEKLLNDKKIAVYAQDKMVLSKILLNEHVSKITFPIDRNILESVIVNASIPQTMQIIPKIDSVVRDTLLSARLINRLANIDLSLLSEKQLEIYKDEQLQKERNREEYIRIIGEITFSGIRELRGELSKNEKEKLGVHSKDFKDWLDTNIGHGKGEIQDVSKDMLEKAKKILERSKKAIEYIKTRGNK